MFGKTKAEGIASVLKEGTQLIDEIFTSKEEKIEGKKKLFEMTIGDKKDARQMYISDSWLQKTFALFFLVFWFIATLFILYYIILAGEKVNLVDWQIAMLSSIYGGITTKLATIVDFLFGGSSSGTNDYKIDKK